MRAISANRRAVREALAHEGWRFALVGSSEELKQHRNSCRTLSLPVGSESERILKEANQTEREVLIQRMGVENFVREAELRQVDSYRKSSLLKVKTAETRSRYQNGGWTEEPLALAFLKVTCPSTQKAYFLRVDPDAENAKQALESTLIGYTRDWERDLVAET